MLRNRLNKISLQSDRYTRVNKSNIEIENERNILQTTDETVQELYYSINLDDEKDDRVVFPNENKNNLNIRRVICLWQLIIEEN